MLLATPSAHEACPAAVMGMRPIGRRANGPARGVRVNNSKVRDSGTNTSVTL